MDIKELSIEQFMQIKDGTYITATEYGEKYGVLPDRIRKYCQSNKEDSKCFKVGSVWYLKSDEKIEEMRNRNIRNEGNIANRKMIELYEKQEKNRRSVSLAVRKKAIEIYGLEKDYFIK